MKIVFILAARYPTEKAYGVTTSYSLSALINMGHFAEIWALETQEQILDSNGVPVIDIGRKFDQKIRRYFSSKSRILRGIAFWINLCAIAVTSLKKWNSSRADAIWTRDTGLALIFAIFAPESRIVLELHGHPNSYLRRFLLSKALRKSNIKVVTISKFLEKKLTKSYIDYAFEIIPMAVPDNFFINKTRSVNEKRLTIGFIGKATSSGHDNSLQNLISQFVRLPNHYQLLLVGIESSYLPQLEVMARNCGLKGNRIKILTHISHKEIVEILRQLDFGIIPYSNTKYNSDRFPIKSLEYAASKTCLLVQDQPSMRELLSEKSAIFYDGNDLDGLKKSLEEAILEESIESRVQNAHSWAKQYTYANRAELFLKNYQILIRNAAN